LTINALTATFDELGPDANMTSIKSALLAVFSEYGVVNQLDVVSACQGERRQAICFLRMGNWEQEQRVMTSFNVGRFGEHLAIAVDLPTRDRSPLALLRNVSATSALV
jgi:hypothetical protein